MKYVPIGLALVFFVVAALYAGGFIGGAVHFKHAALFGILGVLALLWGRFQAKSGTTRAQ